MSFNLFCRLFAIRFTPKLAWRFYKLIQIRFFFPSKEQMLSKESKSSKASQLDALNNPPQIFGDIGNELFLIDYLMGLKTLAEKAVKNELIDDTASNKHSFLYYAIHGNLAEIYIELEDFGKVGSLNHHSHLSPLLSKIDLR